MNKSSWLIFGSQCTPLHRRYRISVRNEATLRERG